MDPRLRRYTLMVGVGSVLILIAGWQWVTWPARTAHHFLELVAADRQGDWIQLLKPPCYAPEDDQKWLITNLAAQNRSLSDVALARQTFAIIVGDFDGDINVNFTVDCGKITRMEREFPGLPN